MPRYYTRRHKATGRRSKLRRSRRIRKQRGGTKAEIMKHLASFGKDQEAGNVPGIYFSMNEEDIEKGNHVLVIGPRYPKQSEADKENLKYAYEECLFFFTIDFPPTYPSVSPKMKHLTSVLDARNPRLHPNLYETHGTPTFDGKVCLSILGTWAGPGWEPTMNIQSTLQTVQSILGPNALVNEPSFEALPDTDPRVVSYNHAAFAASSFITLLVYKMVLEAESEEQIPVEFIKPFYDTLRERAFTAIRFFLTKLAFLKGKYPKGYKTIKEIHHSAQVIDYDKLYDEALALLLLIPPDLAKEVESEDTSVRTEEEAKRAEREARLQARLVEMGMGGATSKANAVAGAPGPSISPMNAWYASLPKPIAAPNNFSWVGTNAEKLNYLAAKYNAAGNAALAKGFRNRAERKRKVNAASKKELNAAGKPVYVAANENEYVYSNNEEQNLEQPENGENGNN